MVPFSYAGTVQHRWSHGAGDPGPVDHLHGTHGRVGYGGEQWHPALVGYGGQVAPTSVVVLYGLLAQLREGGREGGREGKGRREGRKERGREGREGERRERGGREGRREEGGREGGKEEA